MVRGAVVLPHGTGKSQRVVVFAKGDKANEARAAGADAVGAEDLVEKIQKENWPEFDSMVATPGHDGSGRPARPRARSQRADAEPEGRHGHQRRRQGGPRAQGRPRRVPRREGGHRPGPHRQGVVRRRQAARQRAHDDRDAAEAQAAVGEGHVHEVGDACPRRWARASRSTTCRWSPSSRPSSRPRRHRDGTRRKRREHRPRSRATLAKATSLVLADFRGINVKNDTALRREFRINGCEYQVVKNTLLGLAVKGTRDGGDREAASSARPRSPTRSRTRPRPPRSRPRSPRARRSSSSRAATSTARRWTPRASRRCPSCPTRTSCARLSLHFWSRRPRTCCALLRPRRSRCSGCWQRASSSSAKAAASRATEPIFSLTNASMNEPRSD